MKKLIISIFAIVLSVTAIAQQENSTLLSAGDTPQLNLLNPSHMPKSSYIAVPIIGGFAFNTTNSFSYNNVIDGKTLDLNNIKDNSLLRSGANVDILNFGLKIKKESMINLVVRSRVYGGITYPTSAFDFIQNNPITSKDTYDINLNSMAIGWNEVGVGYTHKINSNWSAGGKLKYLMGGILADMSGSSAVISKTSLSSYTVGGDINMYMGNYNAETGEFQSSGLTQSNGFSADLGATYTSDDKKWNIGMSILDLGFINWSSDYSSRIQSKNPDVTYVFDGLGDLEKVFSDGDIGELLGETYDEILESIDADTVKMSFTKMIPTTIHIGSTYSFGKLHTVSGNFMNYIYGGHPYDYSFTAGYTYTSNSGGFRTMGSLTNRKYDPLSIGAGIMVCTPRFQFYIMGDMSVAGLADMKNARSAGLRLGMNFFLREKDK